ncbi:hypothetical protein P7C71_g2516, partial [Lecanoromycetidae sp. Uapishka_2]
MATFSSLPPEITREVLRYLPIRALLDFGLTSRLNFAIQSCSLSSLRLGVFHSRLGGMISLMEATADRTCLHSVQIILPKTESRTKDMVIKNQDMKTRKILDRYQKSLRDLEVALWELQESSASSIARLKNLTRLSIRLDHPHTRYPGVDQDSWESASGSTVWNILGSKSAEVSGALGCLQSLNLERAGITDYQLAEVLESNPRLTELRLKKCFNLTYKLFKTLSESKVGQQLETLHFTKSNNDKIDERVLDCIAKMPKLKSLSFHGCHGIDTELLTKLNEEQWRIPDLTLPSTPSTPKQAVEIDPEYK